MRADPAVPTWLPVSYVVPLRTPRPDPDLMDYLGMVARLAEVVLVDASPPSVFTVHAAALPPDVVHVGVDPDLRAANGKVNGVLTGLRRCRHDRVVLADDDVRYGPAQLERVSELLAHADAVVPQNHFTHLPWHARWDTARSLLNRALGSDHPGTIAVRRSILERTGGYDGDVLFENLELLRTVLAAGGTVRHAPALFVARRPPSAAHFRGQRVRQAYDSLAQPRRLALEFALAPTLLALRRRAPAVLALTCLLAEMGRRRHGGTAVFGRTAALWAPAWVLERAVCSWLAVGARVLRGGVRYGGGRLRRAANSPATLRRRHGVARGSSGPGPTPRRSRVA